MKLDQFKTWITDFRKAFPTSGQWLESRSSDTLLYWFDAVFESLELDDCMSATRRLMTAGEFQAFDRERVPAIIAKLAQDIAYERKERQIAVKERKRREMSRPGTPEFTSSMGAAFRSLLAAKETRGMTREETERFVEEYIDEHYETDELDEPRYRCLTCRDLGTVSFVDDYGRTSVGHCDCSSGQNVSERSWKSGRRLGPIPYQQIETEPARSKSLIGPNLGEIE